MWSIARSAALIPFGPGSRAAASEGFYDSSSPQGMQNFSIRRGFKVCSDKVVENTLYRPDLVFEKIASDPDGKVRAAASQIDFDRLCFSAQN